MTPQYCIARPYYAQFRIIIAHMHMHIHNTRDFSQAKLDSEINACFLLNITLSWWYW